MPPDPAAVAPPVEPAVVSDVASATSFLYAGEEAIQVGVVAETIEPRRAAVLRGRVLTGESDPVAGVAITVLDHPELGQTWTQADGRFDIAVNGGGQLTVRYEKDGFLSPSARSMPHGRTSPSCRT